MIRFLSMETWPFKYFSSLIPAGRPPGELFSYFPTLCIKSSQLFCNDFPFVAFYLIVNREDLSMQPNFSLWVANQYIHRSKGINPDFAPRGSFGYIRRFNSFRVNP